MKNIIFVIDLKVIDVYKQFIERLLASFNITIIVLENFKTTNYFKQKDIFENLNIEFHLYTELFQKVSPEQFKNTNSLTHYFAELTTTLKYKHSYNLSLEYLINKKINIILHTQDISLSNIGLLKAAYDLNIPSIIPSAIMMEPEDYFHKGKSQFSIHNNSTLYEKYVFNKPYGKYAKHKNLFFYTAPVLNFLRKLNLLSTTPWLYGGSPHTKYLCVSNLYHKNISIEHGIDSNKIKIVGDINYDKLHLSYCKHDTSKKNIIILAVPQFFEHNYCAFDEAKERIEYLVNNASSIEGYELILSLHPSMSKYDYIYLEKKFNCTISDKSLSEILPMAELFICVQSNTIIWSTLCHVKTIVADFYNWEYTTSDHLTSCKVFKEKKQFNAEAIITILNSDIDFAIDDKLLSRELVFNGKVIESYIKLIHSTNSTNKLEKVLPYFNPFASLYFEYKQYKKEYVLKQLLRYIQDYKQFYLAPFNNMTQELQSLINSNKFNGYIDSYKKNDYIKDINKIDLKTSCVIIFSPNFSKEIYNSLKSKTMNLYVVNI